MCVGIRQGRYTLTERTRAIMEVKRLQNPESHFEQQTFDIVSAAVSRKNAEKTTAVLLEESMSCMQIPISPDCNRQQALSDISDERSLADRLLDFSSFPLHSVSDELTDLLNPDCFLSEDAEMSSAVNMLLLDTNPPPKTSPEIEAQVDLYDDVIDNLAEALNDMLPHSSQFTDDEIYAILKEGHVSIILTMSCSLWWFIHVWLQQAFQKKGIAYVNNNTLSYPSLLSIDQNDTQKEEPILSYMGFATAIGSLMSVLAVTNTK